ncbi:MAG: hypothetical protein NTY04_04520 [Candidatus Staskawiczbacteria bacterium]|nr:hypothetical protein [Candidatus Staskawiczbacteria bacterium]
MNICEAAMSGFGNGSAVIRRDNWPQGKYLKTTPGIQNIICSLPPGLWTATIDDLLGHNWQVCDANGKQQVETPNALKPPTNAFGGGTGDYILQILADLSMVSSDQIENAKKALASPYSGDSLLKTLINTGVITKKKIAEALAGNFGMETIDLTACGIISANVIKTVPPHVARRYRIIPVAMDETCIKVALSNPMDVDTLDSLRYVLKSNVEGVVATDDDIETALKQYYPGENPEVMVPTIVVEEPSGHPGACPGEVID